MKTITKIVLGSIAGVAGVVGVIALTNVGAIRDAKQDIQYAERILGPDAAIETVTAYSWRFDQPSDKILYAPVRNFLQDEFDRLEKESWKQFFERNPEL